MIHAAFRPVILRDSDPFRKAIYSDYRSRHVLVRLIEESYRLSNPGMRSFFLLLYGLKSYLDAPPVSSDVFCVYSYRNESRRFSEIQSIFGEIPVHQAPSTLRNISSEKFIFLVRNLNRLPRLLSFLRYLSGRHDFLVSCRLSSTLFYYVWFNAELAHKKPQLIALSSEANPYATALLWTAKSRGIPTLYVPHGQVAPEPPRLYFDLCLLDGEELLRTFSFRGEPTGKILFKGADGPFFPLRIPETEAVSRIGVFLSISYDEVLLESVLRQVAARFPGSRILLRLHPNERVSSDRILRSIGDLPRIEVSRNQALREDIARCELIFCGNTGTHLEVLRQGVPSIQLPGIDRFPHDLRGFIEKRIVPFYSSPAEFTLAALKSFYDAHWPERMRRYDFYYGHSVAEIHGKLRQEISAWLRARRGTAGSDRI